MNGLKCLPRAGAKVCGRSLRSFPPEASSLSQQKVVLPSCLSRGVTSTFSGRLQERSFHSSLYHDHASFAVPDVVVDELDARNFGYRVVDPVTMTPTTSFYDEDYDQYSLHMSPTQVTCTSYHVDVLSGDHVPVLSRGENAAVFIPHQPLEREVASLTSFSSESLTDETDVA